MEPSHAPETPHRQDHSSVIDQEANLRLLTPEAQSTLGLLKRKASDLSEQASPRSAKGFLKWRLLCIRSEKATLICMREGVKDAFNKGIIKDKTSYDSLRTETSKEEDELEKEEVELLKQGKFLEEDLQDSYEAIEEALVVDTYRSFILNNTDKERKAKKAKMMAHSKFSNAVATYLDATRDRVPGQVERWCVVLGEWVPHSYTKCAHIVPKSFDTKELSYMFGVGDCALDSARNGLILHDKIEGAFDKGWVVFVPDGSVESTPTEWKIVLLNNTIKDKTFYSPPNTDIIWRWRDIDGRKLTFRNTNRPARRYLYFRYTMGYMHAQTEIYENFKQKVPSGSIWASPGKPDGYLRRSVLRALARLCGDEDLPGDLMEAGGFEDTEPNSGNSVSDQVAGIVIAQHIKRKFDGVEEQEEDDDEPASESSEDAAEEPIF